MTKLIAASPLQTGQIVLDEEDREWALQYKPRGNRHRRGNFEDDSDEEDYYPSWLSGHVSRLPAERQDYIACSIDNEAKDVQVRRAAGFTFGRSRIHRLFKKKKKKKETERKK
jgi:hypothetical protein